MAHHEFAPYLDPGLGVDGGSIWLKLETLLVVDVLVHCIPVVLPVSRISFTVLIASNYVENNCLDA